MKKILITLCIALFLPSLMTGHSPKKVTATWNEKTSNVRIEVKHKVKDAQKHYVETITITQGDKEIKVIPFEKQSETDKEIIEVALPGIAKGSEITILAKCNQVGSRKATLTL